MWQGWVTQFLGAWLALAPIIGVDMPLAELDNFFVGILSALLSASIPTRKAWVSWLGIVAGAWVGISSLFPSSWRETVTSGTTSCPGV